MSTSHIALCSLNLALLPYNPLTATPQPSPVLRALLSAPSPVPSHGSIATHRHRCPLWHPFHIFPSPTMNTSAPKVSHFHPFLPTDPISAISAVTPASWSSLLHHCHPAGTQGAPRNCLRQQGPGAVAESKAGACRAWGTLTIRTDINSLALAWMRRNTHKKTCHGITGGVRPDCQSPCHSHPQEEEPESLQGTAPSSKGWQAGMS